MRTATRLAFQAVSNESRRAWRYNLEQFTVVTSWGGAYQKSLMGNYRAMFSELWEGKDPMWLAVELPHAVRERLIQYAPSHPPQFDPLEKAAQVTRMSDGREGFSAATGGRPAAFSVPTRCAYPAAGPRCRRSGPAPSPRGRTSYK